VDERAKLGELLRLMGGSERSLRRDACGHWQIVGKAGHIYANEGNYLACITASSVRHWSAIKSRLSRFRPTQDGDDEGCMAICEPTQEEACALREVLRVRKRPTLTAEARAKLAQTQFRQKGGSHGEGAPLTLGPVSDIGAELKTHARPAKGDLSPYKAVLVTRGSRVVGVGTVV
jgi:hypothetical protein